MYTRGVPCEFLSSRGRKCIPTWRGFHTREFHSRFLLEYIYIYILTTFSPDVLRTKTRFSREPLYARPLNGGKAAGRIFHDPVFRDCWNGNFRDFHIAGTAFDFPGEFSAIATAWRELQSAHFAFISPRAEILFRHFRPFPKHPFLFDFSLFHPYSV